MIQQLATELSTGPLAQEIAPHLASGNDGAIYGILTRKDIERLGRISAHDIKQYFSLIDLRLPILDSTAPSCRAVTLALEDFPIFDLTIPEVQTKFVSMLDALVAETLIPDFTETHKNTILYLATETVSRADQLKLNVSIENIAQARGLI